IHAFAAWHGDLKVVADVLLKSEDSALRSGVCAAMATISSDAVEPGERGAVNRMLSELHGEAKDGATHSAAGAALRQVKLAAKRFEPSVTPLAGRDWFANRQGMTMLKIPAGKFTMGDQGVGGFLEDKPAHEVTLTRSFYIADSEVTVEQFRKFVEDAD